MSEGEAFCAPVKKLTADREKQIPRWRFGMTSFELGRVVYPPMKMKTIEKERVVRRALRKLLKEKGLVAAKRRVGD